MKRITKVLFLSLLLAACNRQQVCRQDEQSIPGEILRISGLDTLALSKTVPLLIEVAADPRFCIKRAEGVIVNITGNYVQIGARLIYTGERNNGCNCSDESKINTLIYFTPNVTGYYFFSSKTIDGTASNNGSTDSVNYGVFVR